MISSITQTTLFITQWTMILQAMWIICVMLPFTIMATIFILLDWLLLDKFTGFLISGTWKESSALVISPTSPLAITAYVGIAFGFIFLVIFLGNYFVRTLIFADTKDPKAGATFRRFIYILSYILFVLVIPFAVMLFLILIRILTNLISDVFNINVSAINTLNLTQFTNSINTLLAFNNPTAITQDTWDKLWNSLNITSSSDLLTIKAQILAKYNTLANLMNTNDFHSLMLQLSAIGTTNYVGLKTFFNQNNVIDNWTTINNTVIELQRLMEQLQASGALTTSQLSSIQEALGGFGNSTGLTNFSNGLTEVVNKGTTLANLDLTSEGNILPTTNIGYLLYYRVTGSYVNSLSGIWKNWSFLTSWTSSSSPNGSWFIDIIVSIGLGSAVATISGKGIATLVWLLIYRFVALLYSIPLGDWATARSVNDEGSLFKIWFREWVSICISLFIVAFGYVMMKYTVATFANAFENNEIVIDGITTNTSNALFVNIVIITTTIILIYANNAVITKTIEIFASSGITRDNVNNEIVNEYRRAQSARTTVKNNLAKSSKKVTTGIKTNSTKFKGWVGSRKSSIPSGGK